MRGNYSVRVANVLGSIVSSNAILSVYPSAVPVISNLTFSASNEMGFDVVGVPGFDCAVQSSTHLVDWQMLATNPSPFSFRDTNAPYPPRQFYRAVYLP
jgi:MinD superfamily P-loop ATPase